MSDDEDDEFYHKYILDLGRVYLDKGEKASLYTSKLDKDAIYACNKIKIAITNNDNYYIEIDNKKLCLDIYVGNTKLATHYFG